MDQALLNINGEGLQTLEILFFMTLLTLLPSILVMMTSFSRIIIVMSFVRNALGLQQTPPNIILIGISIFLTFFIMSPVVDDISENAYKPYSEDLITQEEALKRAEAPIKEFMLMQTEVSALNMFIEASKMEPVESEMDLPLSVVIPAFMTSELKRAFSLGFLILIPFLLIDIVVSSTLMSMGMIMLPPAVIALPFKILLFVVVNGWEMLFSTLIKGFNM